MPGKQIKNQPVRQWTNGAALAVLVAAVGCGGGGSVSTSPISKQKYEESIAKALGSLGSIDLGGPSPFANSKSSRAAKDGGYQPGQVILHPELNLYQRVDAYRPHSANSTIVSTPDQFDLTIFADEALTNQVGTHKESFIYSSGWFQSSVETRIDTGTLAGYNDKLLLSGSPDGSQLKYIFTKNDPRSGITYDGSKDISASSVRWRFDYADRTGPAFKISMTMDELADRLQMTVSNGDKVVINTLKDGSGTAKLESPTDRLLPADLTWGTNGSGTVRFANGSVFPIRVTEEGIDIL